MTDRTGIWFHVWIKIHPDQSLFEFDKGQENLVQEILAPYHEGRVLRCQGVLIQPRNIESIRIFASIDYRNRIMSKIRRTRFIIRPPSDSGEDTPEWFFKNTCTEITNLVIKIPVWYGETIAQLKTVAAVINRIDPRFAVLHSWITGKGKKRESDFERGVAILLHLSGMESFHVGCAYEDASHPARVKSYNKSKISIDVLAYLPDKSQIYVCQCTTDWKEQEVVDLVDITEELRHLPDLYPTVQVHPVIITTAAKISMTEAVTRVESKGVKVIDSAELEFLLSRIKQKTQSLSETRAMLSLS